MGAFTWENWMDDDYRAFGSMLDGPEYDPEKNPNHRDLPMPSRQPRREPVRGTRDDIRELWIRNGDCPMPGCHGRLDQDFNCPGCGVTSLPRSVAAAGGGSAATEHLDEFAPAQVEP